MLCYFHNFKGQLLAKSKNEQHNKATRKKRFIDTAGSLQEINTSNTFGPQNRKQSFKSKEVEHISYLHLRNSVINTPQIFLRECLCAHNYKRRIHGVPKLQWSTELATKAQNRANQLASIDISNDSEIMKEDENIYVDSVVDLSTSCPRAVESWYREGENYNYSQNDPAHQTGSCNDIKKKLEVNNGKWALIKKYHRFL